MKVLYIANRFPKFSESYIAAEIRYVKSCGIDVAVWPTLPWDSRATSTAPILHGSLRAALAEFKPDLVHFHYAFPFVLDGYIREIELAGLPITVRAHRFPNEMDGIGMLAEMDAVKAIFAFPHFARRYASPKVIPLPVAFDSTRFRPGGRKNPRLVTRTVAGRPGKGTADFLSVAKLCPEFRFTLVIDSGGWEKEVEVLKREAPVNLRIFAQAPDYEVESLMMLSGIYLGTSDPDGGAPFGMPISLAEAMGTGALVFARDVPAMGEYLGEGGILYRSVQEVAQYINATPKYSEEDWRVLGDRAVLRSRSFQDCAVLPRLTLEWQRLLGGTE